MNRLFVAVVLCASFMSTAFASDAQDGDSAAGPTAAPTVATGVAAAAAGAGGVLAVAGAVQPRPSSAVDTGRPECIRIQQVRAFATESETTLIVRQGRSQYRRLAVEDGCPLRSADRIGFAFGGNQFYLSSSSGRQIPVNTTTLGTRVCTATPHAYLVVIDDGSDLRERCRVQGITAATAADFETANPYVDNRY